MCVCTCVCLLAFISTVVGFSSTSYIVAEGVHELQIFKECPSSCSLYSPTALCPHLSNPANGVVSLSGNSEGDTATYACNEGYELVGTPVISCEDGGTWDGPLPTCRCELPKQERHL